MEALEGRHEGLLDYRLSLRVASHDLDSSCQQGVWRRD